VWEAGRGQKTVNSNSSAGAGPAAITNAVPGSPVDLFNMDLDGTGTPTFETLFPSAAPQTSKKGSISDVIAQLSNQAPQHSQHSPIVPDQSALLMSVVPNGSPVNQNFHHSALTPPPAPSQDDLLPEYTGPLPESFHDLTEVQIATVSFKNFTKLMAKSKLNDRQVHEAKKLRRRIKNRVSARTCSTRKRVKCTTTQSSNQLLAQRVAQLSTHNENLLNQHMLLQERCIELQKNEAQLTREKLYAEAECTRMRGLLKQATDAGLSAGLTGLTAGLYANAA
jgi:hypothetical protein